MQHPKKDSTDTISYILACLVTLPEVVCFRSDSAHKRSKSASPYVLTIISYLDIRPFPHSIFPNAAQTRKKVNN